MILVPRIYIILCCHMPVLLNKNVLFFLFSFRKSSVISTLILLFVIFQFFVNSPFQKFLNEKFSVQKFKADAYLGHPNIVPFRILTLIPVSRRFRSKICEGGAM